MFLFILITILKYKLRVWELLSYQIQICATLVSLCLSVFPWAKFRRTKGSIRLHTLLDHSGYLPAFMEISDGKKHEIRVAKSLRLPKGSIVAVDRAYTDYKWFGSLAHTGVYFFTRQKPNATYRATPSLRSPSVHNIPIIRLTTPSLPFGTNIGGSFLP